MTVVVITPPEPLVSLELVKAHLRVDDGGEDALISAYIAAVSEHLDGPEGWLGRAIGAQTLEWTTDRFPVSGALRLPYEPVQSITAVNYLATDGVDTIWAPASYQLSRWSLLPVYGSSWPSLRAYADAVRIRWVAGYDEVPAPITAAALLMVGDLYQNRETTTAGPTNVVPMSATVQALLSPYRNQRV